MGASAGTSPGPISVPTARPSHIYQPSYQSMGLGATPQASQFTPQMPTYNRSRMTPMQSISSLFGGRTQPNYSISMPVAPSLRPTVDPNLAAINRAFAPQRPVYDGEGGSYMPTRYMEQSQRNAILQNPGNYLNYARYVGAGNDPSTYRAALQRPQMMSQAQRNSLMASQRAELSGMLPPAPPSDSGG